MVSEARGGQSTGWGSRALRGLLIFMAGGLLGANVVYYLLRSQPSPCPGATAPACPVPPEAGAGAARPAPRTGAAAPAPPPVVGEPVPSPDGAMIIPVAGVQPGQLVDTYTQSRGSGRRHDAIDIMAAAGTPVLAAVEGRVVKLFASEAGGITLYQFDPGETFVYYYAHLQGYAPGIVEGRVLRKGEVLGYVGSTGNAKVDAPHLHFAIARLGPDKRWYGGTPINPYPLLSGRPAAAPAASAPAPVPGPTTP